MLSGRVRRAARLRNEGRQEAGAELQEGTVNELKSVNSRKSITGYEAEKRDLQRKFYFKPFSFLLE